MSRGCRLRVPRTIAALAVATAVLGDGSRLVADEANKACPFDVARMDADELERRLESVTGNVLGSCAMNAIRGGDSRARSAVAKRAAQLLPLSDQYERMRLISLLGEAQDQQYVPRLLGFLGDRSLDVQHTAIGALERLHDPRAIRPLAALLRDRYVGLDAVGALAAIGSPEAAEALADLADDSRVEISRREAAASRLQDMGDPRGAALYRKATDARRPEWRYVLFFPPLIYLFNWLRARSGSSRKRAWRVLTFMAAGAGMIFVNPVWLFSGMRDDSSVFAVLAVAYPLGTALVGAGLGGLVRLRAPELGEKMMGGMAVVPLVMWATLALWIMVAFVLMSIGLARVLG